MYLNIFEVRMIVKPRVSFFLDVDPEVAYSRKQDYSYETMLTINRSYKNYMNAVDGVKVIDANRTQKEIYNEVVSIIVDLDKNIVTTN